MIYHPLGQIIVSRLTECKPVNTLAMASASNTQPPQVPPLTSCKAAQSRVSSGIGDDRDVLAEISVPERRRDLIDLLHAGTHGPAAHQDQHVAGLDAVRSVALDGGHGRGLGAKHARAAGLTVDAAGIHHAGVN